MRLESEFSPYVAFGADLPPYDLGAQGAVAEVKRALRALGELHADPLRNPPGTDIATETTWKAITLHDDLWDDVAAEEFLLAVSRYRGLGWQVPEPYAQLGEPGAAPQPTIGGLELIAGAVHDRLGGSPPMVRYEQWREAGCVVCFDPPSAMSRPPATTPVFRTKQIPLVHTPPADAPKDLLAKVVAADAAQQSLWLQATMAETEAARAKFAVAMQAARVARAVAVQAAVDAAPERTGVTLLDEAFRQCVAKRWIWDPYEKKCSPPVVAAAKPPHRSSGGLWVALGLLAAGGVGVALWRQKRGRR